MWFQDSTQLSGLDIFAVAIYKNINEENKPLTSVYYLILVTPVDSFDELVDVAADFIGRCTVGQFL